MLRTIFRGILLGLIIFGLYALIIYIVIGHGGTVAW